MFDEKEAAGFDAKDSVQCRFVYTFSVIDVFGYAIIPIIRYNTKIHDDN